MAAESFQSHELLIRVPRIERKLDEFIVSQQSLSPEATRAKADEPISRVEKVPKKHVASPHDEVGA